MTFIRYTEKRAYLEDGALIGRDSSGNEQGGIMFEDGPPKSGTSGTGVGYATKGTLLIDGTNGVTFINEGTSASPYWTPCPYDQPKLWGVNTDFRSQTGEPVADTDAEAILSSGLRVYGQGLAETDSGLVVQTAAEGGNVARITTTDEDAHTIAIGMEDVVMQPDQHSLLVIDVEFTNVSAITARAIFCGFIGAAADALDPVVTGATTTATLVLDDLAGLFMDAGFTDADGIMAVSEKSNTAGTQTGLTNVGTMPAAGTYTRLRVECDSTGSCRGFQDKVDLGLIPGATGANTHSASEDALDADEEVSPVFYLESQAAATKSIDVRRFATWAYRTT